MATSQSRLRSTAPPKGEPRAWTNSLAPRFAAEISERVPSPRRALPLLGEVPSAHTGERGLQTQTRCRTEKTAPTPTILFPTGTPSALSVSLALDSSPKGGAKPLSVSLALDSSPEGGAKGVDHPTAAISVPQVFKNPPPAKC